MTNKASNQQDDIWGAIARVLVEAVKMVFSFLVLIFASSINVSASETPSKKTWDDDDGFRNGQEGPGYYEGGFRLDKDDD